MSTNTDYKDIGDINIVILAGNCAYTNDTDTLVCLQTGSTSNTWYVDGVEIQVGFTVFLGESGTWNGIYSVVSLPHGLQPCAYLQKITWQGNFKFNVTMGEEYKGSSWIYHGSQYICISSVRCITNTEPSEANKIILDEIKTTLHSISCSDLVGMGSFSDYTDILAVYKQFNKEACSIKEILEHKTDALKKTNKTLSEINQEIALVSNQNQCNLVSSLYGFVQEMGLVHSNLTSIRNGITQSPQKELLGILGLATSKYESTTKFVDSFVAGTAGNYTWNEKCDSNRSMTLELFADLNTLLYGIDVFSYNTPIRFHEILTLFKCKWASELQCNNTRSILEAVKSILAGMWSSVDHEPCEIADSVLTYWIQHGEFASKCFTVADLEGIVDQICNCSRYDNCNGNTVLLEKGESIGCEIQFVCHDINMCVTIFLKQI